MGDNKFFYAVELADGSRLDFDTNGDWVTIDSRVKAVPATAVPANISSYVKQIILPRTLCTLTKCKRLLC